MPVAGVETLEAYGAATASCTRCRLAQGRTQVVFGAGNPRADLMFVGEAPGFHEDKQGVPFVGQALLGKKPGDTIKVEAPRGRWSAKIVSVGRAS